MARRCIVDGCERPHDARGYCKLHYRRWQKSGDPVVILPPKPRRSQTLNGAFWARVDTSHRSGCWVWIGKRDRDGYGNFSFSVGGRRMWWLAHRMAYEIARGPIPAGLTIDHLCFNKPCVNPWHLEPVTNEENIRRGIVAGLVRPLSPWVPSTEELRSAVEAYQAGVIGRDIARHLGRAESTLRRVLREAGIPLRGSGRGSYISWDQWVARAA